MTNAIQPQRTPLLSRAAALAIVAASVCTTASADVMVTLDFEGLPDKYYYDSDQENLGMAYASKPGAPVFGQDATLLGIGRELDDTYMPPASGSTVLHTDLFSGAIEVEFTGQNASAVSLYYRSYTDIKLFAFDDANNLVGQSDGDPSVAPGDPAGLLQVATASRIIRSVRIEGAQSLYIIDDFTYVVPEPHEYAMIAGLGLAGLALWRRRS